MAARRLPVIQSPPPEDAEARDRPARQWVLIGAGFTVTFWLPLVTLAVWVQSRALVLLSFVIAALLAGSLVGHFGVRATLSHVALSGACGGAIGFLLSLLGGPPDSWALGLSSLLVLVAVGGAFAALGGFLARSLRRRKV